MKRTKIICLVVILLLTVAFGATAAYAEETEASSVACPSVNGPLHVEGTQLVDQDGEPVQLRGVSTHGLAWFPDYVNLDCFTQLRQEWNANVIRLAMYTAEYGGYCSGGDQQALKDLVDQGVRFAQEADMYVIVDWHILSDNDPNLYRDAALSFFRDVSARYADMDHVIYEICNEPNGGTTWRDVRSYALEVITVIRQNDPDAVILIGTPNWSQNVDQAAADPITVYDNIMYTLHYYAATHKGDLRDKLTAAVNSGLPVFVSEYGVCEASGNGVVDTDQANQWADLLDRLGISYVMWNLSNKNESSSILRPECSVTAGFTQDDLSPAGQWLYQRLTGAIGPAPAPGETAAPDAQQPAQSGDGPASDTMSIEMEMVNSWQSNGGVYRQYNLTLTNITGAELDGWTVTVPFDKAFTVSDGWNGVYSISGTDLQITPMDYNRFVPAGETVSEVGFILRF